MTMAISDRSQTGAGRPRADSQPILEVTNLSVDLPMYRGRAPVVTGVTFRVNPVRLWRWIIRMASFAVAQGQTFGIVGESGSGKSTTGAFCLALSIVLRRVLFSRS
jgi:peptide/nickel transport system ATP-binding protein